MSIFKNGIGNWIEYRKLPCVDEIDLHRVPDGSRNRGPREVPYENYVVDVWDEVLKALQSAQQRQRLYVIFRHGWSTSRSGQTTARSQVRKLMRSKFVTPYIIRKNSIQHNAVFVATIKPK